MPHSLSSSLLLRLTREALVSLFHCSAQFEARLCPGAAMVLTGEPFADLNYIVVGDAPRAEEAFRDLGAICVDRKIPFLAILGPAVAEELADAATELGLRHAAAFPLMLCETPNVRPGVVEGADVVRVETAESLRDSAAVLSGAFELSTDSVIRTWPIETLENPVLDIFVARLEGRTVSSVTTTIHDDLVGIWAMGTAPEYRRRGMGRFLLTEVMAAHVRRGARHFFLGATPAGKALYEQIGFVTRGVAQAWVAGQTSQA